MGALAIGTTVASTAAQARAAKDAAKYQNRQYSAVADHAQQNYLQQLNTLQNRVQQENAASSQIALQNRVAADHAVASTAVAAGEAGIQGNTVNLLFDDFRRTEAENAANIQTNVNWFQRQAQEEALALRAQAQGHISAAMPQPIRGPSSLATALQIGTQAFEAYDFGMRTTQSGPYNPNNSQPGNVLFNPIFKKRT
jgi:hypothetical protein